MSLYDAATRLRGAERQTAPVRTALAFRQQLVTAHIDYLRFWTTTLKLSKEVRVEEKVYCMFSGSEDTLWIGCETSLRLLRAPVTNPLTLGHEGGAQGGPPRTC